MNKLLMNLGFVGVFFLASACQKVANNRNKGLPSSDKAVGSSSDQTSGDPLKPNPAPTNSPDAPSNPPAAPTIPRYFAYVGGGDKISVYRFEVPAGILTLVKNLAVPTANTSFLALHKTNPWLYAANESGSGGVIAFSIDRDSGNLTKLNEIPAGGGGPTHVSIDQSGKYVLAANYGTGQITSYLIQDNGSLGPAVANINAGLNAHQILSAPTGEDVFVPCLGSNYIAQYRLNPQNGQLTAANPGTLSVVSGGPRHMAFHPKKPWAYILKELDSTVQALSLENNPQRLSLLGTPQSTRSVQATANTGAEVQVHPSGNFVYTSNRGDNTIAVFTVNTDGTVTLKSVSPSGGGTPRHFSIDPSGKWLLAANQDSGTVNVLKLDPASGDLEANNKSVNFASAQFVEVIDLNQYRPSH